MKIDKSGNWQRYWGATPLPEGAQAFGTITRKAGDTGALIRLASGIYVQGNAHVTRSLPQDQVTKALK